MLIKTKHRYSVIVPLVLKLSKHFAAISASRYNNSYPVNREGLNFPTAKDLGFMSDIVPVMVKVPLEVIQERLQSQIGGN